MYLLKQLGDVNIKSGRNSFCSNIVIGIKQSFTELVLAQTKVLQEQVPG